MAKEVAQGRELLQHYRRRRKLGLLPGRRTSAATVAAERADALLSHSAFGYFPPDRPRAQLQLELASRRKALEAQVAELEAAEEAQRALAAEAEQRQHALQREMAAAVEEHSQLSRQLPELRARRQELGREAWRLKALLQDGSFSAAPPRARRRLSYEKGGYGKGYGYGFSAAKSWGYPMMMPWGFGKGKGKGLRGFANEKKVWIGGLPAAPPNVEMNKKLKEHMAAAGECVFAEINRNGVGGAAFKSPEDVQKAVEMLNGSVFEGSTLEVDVWQRKTPAAES
ncbi:unnamed protein product [Effrenium voratum]|nr:unnamed protein product [Effrenium voratum]